MFNIKLEMLAEADLVVRLRKGSLRRSCEAVEVVATLWFNAARANVTCVNRLKKSFQRSVRDAKGAAGFDGVEAAVIDPVVNDLPGNLETRSYVIRSKVISTHVVPHC